MKVVRIELTHEADVQAVQKLKSAVRERTASKAMLQAARLYPSTLRELEDARRQIAELRQFRDTMREGFRQALGLEALPSQPTRRRTLCKRD